MQQRRHAKVVAIHLIGWAWLTVCAITPSGCAAAHAPLTPTDETQTYQKIVADLCDPAMQGRGVGTKGLDRAKNYLIDCFRSMRLRPAFTINGKHSFTQSFDVELELTAEAQSLRFTNDDTGKMLDARAGIDVSTLGISASGDFAGQAAFVGYGIIAPQRGYNSYANVDNDSVRGRVVIAFRYEPQDGEGVSRWTRSAGRWSDAAHLLAKARWAQQQGATALLLVNPPRQDVTGGLRSTAGTAWHEAADIPVMHVHSSWFKQLLRSHGLDAEAAVRQYEKLADEGRGQVVAFDDLRIEGEAKLTQATARVANVAAVIPGRGTLARQFVVLGAHYDHLGQTVENDEVITYFGADDNASGVAGMLLLAERFNRRNRSDNRPRRTLLIVAFTAEERGLFGSAHMLHHLQELGVKREQIVAMLNLDMIGRLDRSRLAIAGIASADRWPALINASLADLNLRHEHAGLTRSASDHVCFYAVGIPVLQFSTGLHRDYHRPSDTPEKINVPGALQVVEAVDEMLTQVLHDEQRPTFQEDDQVPLWFARMRGLLDGKDRAPGR